MYEKKIKIQKLIFKTLLEKDILGLIQLSHNTLRRNFIKTKKGNK